VSPPRGSLRSSGTGIDGLPAGALPPPGAGMQQIRSLQSLQGPPCGRHRRCGGVRETVTGDRARRCGGRRGAVRGAVGTFRCGVRGSLPWDGPAPRVAGPQAVQQPYGLVEDIAGPVRHGNIIHPSSARTVLFWRG
jgi:hypothetical protein